MMKSSSSINSIGWDLIQTGKAADGQVRQDRTKGKTLPCFPFSSLGGGEGGGGGGGGGRRAEGK